MDFTGFYDATSSNQYVERTHSSAPFMPRGTPISPSQQLTASPHHHHQHHQQHQPSVLENLINSSHYGSPMQSSQHVNGSGNQSVSDLPFGNAMQQNDEVNYREYMIVNLKSQKNIQNFVKSNTLFILLSKI